jgi:hypothetical protein
MIQPFRAYLGSRRTLGGILFCLSVVMGFIQCSVGAWTADDSCAGKTILTTKHDIRIGHTDDKDRQVYVATLAGTNYKVIADKDGFIKVRAENGAAW